MNAITQPDAAAVQRQWEAHYLWPVIEFTETIGLSMRRGLWPASVFGNIGEKILARKFQMWEAEHEVAEQRARDAMPAPPVPVRIVDPTELDGQPVPPRTWFVPDLIPSRNVTLPRAIGVGWTTVVLLEQSALLYRCSTRTDRSW